jgi:broad specificity phosphatase PhoE
MRLTLLSLFAAVSLGAQSPTVVILSRHAEKATAPANDPPLTEAGTVRAKALAAAVANANVQAVIATTTVRTRETARPAAEAAKLSIEEVPTAGGAAHIAAVAAAVRKHPGQTVLVVGHSNTIPAIIAALGGPRMPDLCDDQYSALFTLVIDGASVKLIKASYGAASPASADNCGNAMR